MLTRAPSIDGDGPHAPSYVEDGGDRVRLLDVEPDLALGLPASDQTLARRLLVAQGTRLAPGPWRPVDGQQPTIGALVVGGLIIREAVAFGRRSVQLFGPGDVIDGRVLARSDGGWLVLDRARLAMLNDGLIVASRRWPAVTRWLTQRLFEAQEERQTLAAITALPRVEQRVLGLLCHLAERWGHVTPDGVTVRLPATHALLGDLIGARRPTVSLALTALHEQQLLRRLPDGRWLLPAGCHEWQYAGIPDVRPTTRVAVATPAG